MWLSFCETVWWKFRADESVLHPNYVGGMLKFIEIYKHEGEFSLY
jgi:hypothetical protein